MTPGAALHGGIDVGHLPWEPWSPAEAARRLPGDGLLWPLADPAVDAPAVLAAVHQTWVADPRTEAYVLDVFREPHSNTQAGDTRRTSGRRTRPTSTGCYPSWATRPAAGPAS